MKNLKYLFPALVATALACTACDDDDQQTMQPSTLYESVEFALSDEVRVKLYTDETNTTTLPLIKGESVQLDYTVTPDRSEVTFPELTWTSSDASVASVDETGCVTALAAGSALITVTPATVNVVVTASLKITVVGTVVPATSITITDDHEMVDEEYGLPSCYVGETMTLTAAIEPADATYRSVMWSSNDPATATIDPITGVVTGVARGQVTLVATALDENRVTASHEIYIDQSIDPVGIRITDTPADKFSITDGGYTIAYETYPTTSTKSLIRWTSSDTSVATVDRGTVKFVGCGDATITATCVDSDQTLPEGFAKSISIEMSIPAGFYHEHFDDENITPWNLNSDHIKSGATQSREYDAVTGEYYMLFTPYLSGSKGRGDIQHSNPTYLSTAYPILCFRIDDVNDAVHGGYARNITLDTSGTVNGTKYSGGLNGNNNKWATKYKCSDGSAILVYDTSTQSFATGGLLSAAGTVGTFTTFQLKYADISTLTNAEDAQYRMFWFHTFVDEAEMTAYLGDWSARTGITFE